MSAISTPTQFLLSLSMIKGVGSAALKIVASIPSFHSQEPDELARQVPQIARALSKGCDWLKAKDDAAKQIDCADKFGARILSPIDSEYPRLLSATKDAPFILYVKGALATNPERSVAVIGTREPTAHGVLIATRITQFFAEQNWSIVSGLAIGCDGIAHQAALDVGAHTVAVLAHGLHMIAPARHKKLAQDILDAGGALISEYPFGQNVQNQQYVKRDRTQAGMAQGVVMIQSDIKGGSLHASRASLEYGRWLAVPYPTDRDRDYGELKVQANLLIADGNNSDRADLLRCSTSALKQIILLRSREDYVRMIETTEKITPVQTPKRTLNDGQSEFLYGENKEGLNQVETVSQPTESTPSKEVESVCPLVESEINKELTSPVHSPSRCVTFPSLATRCNVLIISINSVDALKITQMPTPSSKWFQLAKSIVSDIENLELLSKRLRHLQRRLDDVCEMCCNDDVIGVKDNPQFLQFSVEELLMQMKRAVDALVALNRYSAALRSGNATTDIPQLQSNVRLCFSGAGERQNKPDDYLIAFLDRLVNASALSIVLETNTNGLREHANSPSNLDRNTVISFDHLICSLNSLIEETLCISALPSRNDLTIKAH